MIAHVGVAPVQLALQHGVHHLRQLQPAVRVQHRCEAQLQITHAVVSSIGAGLDDDAPDGIRLLHHAERTSKALRYCSSDSRSILRSADVSAALRSHSAQGLAVRITHGTSMSDFAHPLSAAAHPPLCVSPRAPSRARPALRPDVAVRGSAGGPWEGGEQLRGERCFGSAIGRRRSDGAFRCGEGRPVNENVRPQPWTARQVRSSAYQVRALPVKAVTACRRKPCLRAPRPMTRIAEQKDGLRREA